MIRNYSQSLTIFHACVSCENVAYLKCVTQIYVNINKRMIGTMLLQNANLTNHFCKACKSQATKYSSSYYY